MKSLPPRILVEIGVLRTRAIDTRELVNVYGEAERIRRGGLDENVALEDIADEIREQCRDAPGFEIDVFEAQSSFMNLNKTYH